MTVDPPLGVAESAPARPRRLTVRFDRTGNRLEASRRGQAGVPGAFLFLWLIGWTVGCIWLAREAINNPGVFPILFGIPFWSSWIFVVCVLLRCLFQREVIVLDSRGVTFARRVLVPLSSRTVPLAEIQSFDDYSMAVDSESGRHVWGIEMRTLGEALRFFEGLSNEERRWLQFQLTEQLAHLRRWQHVTPAAAAAQDSDQADAAAAQSATAVQPPSDCRWQRLDDFDAVQFVERGRWNFGMLGGLLFINAFWNGIVAVFVAGLFGGMPGNMPQGWMWWGMFVFLIPFEAIGLVMFAGLILSLLEPLRRSRWRFGRQEIESATTWLGVGPRHRYAVQGLDRVEIRQGTGQESFVGRCALGGGAAEGPATQRSFALALIDRGNTELCTVTGLTEGEARWMADGLLRERAEWFR